MAKIIASNYEVIREIGSGGGGVVYLAKHLRLDKAVVLKADKRKITTRKDFLRREVDILKELSHTYIPQVYDFFDEDDTVYTVIDYIEGESLDKPLKAGIRFSQPQVIRWSIQLLEALRYLHSPEHGDPPRGFVHSDIKPANIMCRPNGDICLIDFNIALALGEENAVGRSAGYASPEHYGLDFSTDGTSVVPPGSGDGDSTVLEDEDRTRADTEKESAARSVSSSGKRVILPDVRSDIYSLGATLYHLLSGTRPARHAKEVVPLSEKEFSPQIVRIIQKAMEPNPDLRYQSAQEMLDALLNLRENDPRSRRLKRTRRITTAALAVTLAAGVAVSFVGLKRMQTAESWKKLAEYSANALREGDPEAAIGYALQAFPETGSLLQPEYLAETQKALTDALGVYDLSDGYKSYGTVELPSAPLFLSISPDGTTFAAVYATAVAVCDTESCVLLDTLPAADSALSEAVYVDAETLLYAGAEGISLYDISSGSVKWTGEDATALAVSGNGKSVAGIYKDETTVSVYDTESGARITTVDLEGKHQSVTVNDVFANPQDNLLALNGDGTLLAVSTSDGSLEVFDLSGRGRDMIILDESSGYTHFEGGFYQQYFAFSASNGEASVFAVIDMEAMEQTGGFQSQSRFSVLTDENGIYVQTENLLVRIDPVSGEQTPMVTTAENISCYAVAETGALIVTDGSFSFYGENAVQIDAFEKQDETDFAMLAGGIAVLGSRSSPVIRLLEYEDHPEAELFSYDASEAHDEARVSADGSRIMLFSWQRFLVYDLDGNLLNETFLPDAEQIYDQQFRREDGESWLEVIYNDGRIRYYSAEDGSLFKEEQGDVPDSSLYEEFYVNSFRVESPLHGAPTVYSVKNGKEVGILREEDYLTYVTAAGENFIAQFITADGYSYGLLYNPDCEVLAELPYLCDVINNVLIFDYPTGDLRQSRIYDIEELVDLAQSVLEEGR